MDRAWLNSFVGQRITILTGAVEERSDTGTLVRIGEGWLQIVKDNGEMILVPGSAIRIVKLLDMTQTVPAIDRGAVYVPPVPDQADAPSGF